MANDHQATPTGILMTQREAEERIAKLIDRRDKVFALWQRAHADYMVTKVRRDNLEREIDAINDEIALIAQGQLQFDTSSDPINQHKHEVSDERVREGPQADGVGRGDHQPGK
jgi:hypothetical protein